MSAAPPRRTYYNERDPEKAAWIRELMKAGLVAPGEVDERDIQQVRADDLKGFCQHHFFAGIAVWSYSLRLAGWPDDRPVWTGSCPCPSFSSAGKGAGFDDPRHLWPEWHRLVREYRPRTILGEQVASAIQHGWLDLVATDLEAEGYAVAAAVLGAHSAGAPHIRQRLYFVADTEHDGHLAADGLRAATESSVAIRENGIGESAGSGDLGELADPTGPGRNGRRAGGTRDDNAPTERSGSEYEPERLREAGERSTLSELGESISPRLERYNGDEQDGNESGWERADATRPVTPPSVLSGFWRDAEWIWCRDQKYRPVRSGTFPLVDGGSRPSSAPARLRRWHLCANCGSVHPSVSRNRCGGGGVPRRAGADMKIKARLTKAEDYRWQVWWSHAVLHGYSSNRAGAYAWRRIQEEFPRLRKYEAAAA